ncbi:hypothetical protein KFK09_007409 [Dendrobium nobile]|uniref:Uncharacterized protein n=1 Tax=Dendrobium nobile TaxID=94219 RepID=A0A8T3BV46_DENNO|nr:hypothetical protein KFK09_007409 [Dendrobium nobile]
MSACCRSSPDLTLLYEDRLRRHRRRTVAVHAPAAHRSRLPAADAVGGLLVLEAVWLRCSEHKWARRRGHVRDRAFTEVRLNAVGERIGDFDGQGLPMVAEAEEEEERRRRAGVVAAAVMTAVLGTGNRVFYKLALVPLKRYPFFLAQLATFGYVVVYFSILYGRYHAGIVTDEMLSLPKIPFMVVGLLEALGAASGMAAGGIGSGSGISLQNVGIFWILLMISSFFLQAADTVLKEKIFLDSTKWLKGGSVDLFVVNSFGSAFQAMFICLLLPFLSKLWGIPFSMLPTYIKDGGACFLNIGKLASGCEGAPMLPLLFVVVNMAFNISMLHVVKVSSAVASCLASTFSVPLSIYAFTLPLPFIGAPSPLPAGFMLGAAVLVAGLLIYTWTPSPARPTTKLSPETRLRSG